MLSGGPVMVEGRGMCAIRRTCDGGGERDVCYQEDL